MPLDAADGGAAENILLEEGVKYSSGSSTETETEKDSSPTVSPQDTLLSQRLNVLHPVEQALLLALCLNIHNCNAAVIFRISIYTYLPIYHSYCLSLTN